MVKVYCIGVGGNGQTYVMDYLKDIVVNNIDDKDGLKHLCCPTKIGKAPFQRVKVIYVYNKTFDSICSHYRRQWAPIQMQKIRKHENNKYNAYNDVNKYFDLVESTITDHFGMEDHFIRWYQYRKNMNVYYLNMACINKQELAKFLECDVEKFRDLNFDSSSRHKYNDLKQKYPLSVMLYENIDNKIKQLSEDHNKKLFI
jgi:hypothetical protein